MPSESAPRFAAERPGDTHTPTIGHRYRHYTRELTAALERRSTDLAVSPDSSVLDYGCADLPYRAFFPQTTEYVGADLPGNPRASLTINPDGTLPVDDGEFDAVVSTQVLEHVTDPATYLDECYRVLRPGGRLMLSTHGIFIFHPDPVDHWRWTGAGLERIITDAGFLVRDREGVVGLLATGLQLVQDAVYWKLPVRIRPVFAAVMQSFIALADRAQGPGSKRYNASVFVVIAEKP